MKQLFITSLIFLFAMQNSTQAQDISATKDKKTFKLTYTVSIDIDAPTSKVWQILTDAEDYTRWNSTIKSLKGTIALGEQIKLISTVDTSRAFKLKVKKLDVNKLMIWSSGVAPMFKGVRTYTLKPNNDGTIKYTMTEVLSGVMLPMIAGSLPDFRPSFKQFAIDLKTEAER